MSRFHERHLTVGSICAVLLTLVFVFGSWSIGFAQTATPTPPPATQEIIALVPQVIAEYPHDPEAFTQGLLLHDGVFYESTGRYDQSTLRKVEIETGEVLESVDLSGTYFAEGLALVDDRLIQLTWKEQTALVYDLEDFSAEAPFSYETEGWGLCYDGDSVYLSDGSTSIFQHDPETFEVIAEIPVTIEGQPVAMINELECVGDDIYANIWQTDFIVRIDKETGNINAVVDARGLLTEEERLALPPGGVLNGIAYDPETEHFYITGKLWSQVFEVEFVPFEPASP